MTAVAAFLGALLGLGVWLLLPSRTHARPARQTGRVTAVLGGLLDEAGLSHYKPGAFVAVSLLLSAVSALGMGVILPIPALSVIATVFAPLALLGVLYRRRAIRRHTLRLSWPGVIDHIRAGVRSGGDVTSAFLSLPDSYPSDITSAVSNCRRRIEGGMSTDTALEELRVDWADPFGDRIVEVLRMTHEVGGTSLPSLLRDLQNTIRHDIAVRQDAHARQSWIRSASVLAVSAPWVVLFVIGGRGETLEAYQSLEGNALLLLGAVSSGIAFFLMRKIAALPEPRRWLTT